MIVNDNRLFTLRAFGGAVAVALTFLLAGSAQAVVIADFQADFAFPTPAAGWAYSRNPLNVNLNTPANWVALQPDTGNLNHYGADGSNPGWPDAAPGSYTIVGGAAIMHPGEGFAQAADGLEHYAITSYTLSNATTASIINLAANVGGSQNGTHIVIATIVGGVYSQVNDLQVAPNSSIAPAAIPLGLLPAGARVVVALGPNATDGSDGGGLQYQINAVPEPGSLALFGAGVVGVLVMARRRRAG